jgi:hypothetical protein
VVVIIEHTLALPSKIAIVACEYLRWGEAGQSAVVMREVVPVEVRFSPGSRLRGVAEATGIVGLVFQRLEVRRTFRRTRHQDVEALVRILVFNRLCDPESKLGVLRWLETVALPDMPLKAVTHQHLLRSMDVLVANEDAVDRVVAGLLRPLIDQDLSVVFYDLTTIRAEGGSTVDSDVRHFGMAKSGAIERQFMLGVVQTAEGIPIYHEVFGDNVAETRTLQPTLATLLAPSVSINAR